MAYVRMQTTQSLVFLPLGDSYTIGTGVSKQESWPYLLLEELKQKKIDLIMPVNPAQNGFATQDLIEQELPLVEKIKPDLVTVLIGVNDWVRGVRKEIFRKNLIFILDEVQARINENGKIVLLTIPDFGVTPAGKNYGSGRDISLGISEFNTIIKNEAKSRNLILVDIFELSKEMGRNRTLVAQDGLHPSGLEYERWKNLLMDTFDEFGQ